MKIVMANVIVENGIMLVDCPGCNNVCEPNDLKAEYYMVGRNKYAKYFCPDCGTTVLSGIKVIDEDCKLKAQKILKFTLNAGE